MRLSMSGDALLFMFRLYIASSPGPVFILNISGAPLTLIKNKGTGKNIVCSFLSVLIISPLRLNMNTNQHASLSL